MSVFWLCFVPLFVAVDALGGLPIFISLTEKLEPARRRRVIVQSVTTASAVAVVFLLFGPALLRYMGLTVPDFMIAGGILLLAISLSDLLTGEKKESQLEPESLGAVPIGIPLLTGPAVLTTCILLANTHGIPVTALAAVANVLLAGVVFRFADPITRALGRTGIGTASKVASMLLASIAVMLIRRGIVEAIQTAAK
jgi:multiple antibiotic resistance protein